MLEARKSQWFENIFTLYNRSLFWRRFKALRVAGIERLLDRDKSFPLVLYANHSSWWDGLVAFEIGRAAALDHFVMMDERQLQSLFLFRKLGAFSVNRESPREIKKSINYAVKILREKQNRALWIFPQGEILPSDRRPLQLQRGAGKIAIQTAPCFVAPVAMRYEFLGDFKPEAFARIGQLELIENYSNTEVLTNVFTRNLTATLEHLKIEIANGTIEEFRKLI